MAVSVCIVMTKLVFFSMTSLVDAYGKQKFFEFGAIKAYDHPCLARYS